MKADYVDIHTHHPTEALTLRTVGVHPWQAATASLPDEEAIRRADAVGEIGLDFVCGVDRTVQERLFMAQLDLAERLEKPIVLHCVRAFEEVMCLLKGRPLRAVIFHGFIGSSEQAARAIEAGYYLSFGARTRRSPKTIEALRRTPLDRLFIESDEADEAIEKLYDTVAAWREMTVEALQAAICQNYKRILTKQ